MIRAILTMMKLRIVDELATRLRAVGRPFAAAAAAAAAAGDRAVAAKSKTQQRPPKTQPPKKKKAAQQQRRQAAPRVPVVLPAGLPKTDAVYLRDTHRFTLARARVLAVSAGPSPGQATVVLDATIFHPQGGGQPADLGSIKFADWEFAVEMVTVDRADGVVPHVGALEGNPAARVPIGSEVSLAIDEAHRLTCAGMHSGGLLLDVAMLAAGMGHLKPGKGFHFNPAGCYVEYIGAVPADERAPLVERLNAALADLVAADIRTKVVTLDLATDEGAGALSGLLVHPPADAASADPSAGEQRVVLVGGEKGCGCGGTHVVSTAELIGVHVTKCKVKKGMTKLSYYVGAKRE